jgi:putative membrane protein
MRAVLIVAGLALASPVAAQSLGEKTGVNSMLGVAPSTVDFVREAASSDMYEIKSSELAVERGDEPTKAFARQMIADHQKTTAELKEMVAKGVVKEHPADAMLPAHQSKFDKLKDLKGAEFTKQYRSDQEAAHKDAVSLFSRYAKGGDNEQLKAWAGRTLPALEHHLQMADKLND